MKTKQKLMMAFLLASVSLYSQQSFSKKEKANLLIEKYSFEEEKSEQIFKINSFGSRVEFVCSVGENNWIRIDIYNEHGAFMLKLEVEGKAYEIRVFSWNAVNAKGYKLPKGKYYVFLNVHEKLSKKKVIFIE